MANAVYCLETDPMLKTVREVMGVRYSRFATPYPLRRLIFPFLTTATATPGVAVVYSEKRLSTVRSMLSCVCAITVAGSQQSIITIIDRVDPYRRRVPS